MRLMRGGFSLVEVLVTGMLLGVMSTLSIKMLGMRQEHADNIYRYYERDNLYGQVVSLLGNPTVCTNTFRAMDTTLGPKIPVTDIILEQDSSTTPATTVASFRKYNSSDLKTLYGNRSIVFDSMHLNVGDRRAVGIKGGGTPEWYRIPFEIGLKKMGAKVTTSTGTKHNLGGDVRRKIINITAKVDGAGKIIFCYSSSAGSGSEIWKYTTSAVGSNYNIFYRKNQEIPTNIPRSKVLIGRPSNVLDEPFTKMDVKGAISLGDGTTFKSDGTLSFHKGITTKATLKIYRGDEWQEIIPIGTIAAFNSDTCPYGWETYGHVGRTFIQRLNGGGSPVGVPPALYNNDSPGPLVWGNANDFHTLTMAEMHNHTHVVNDPGHTHVYERGTLSKSKTLKVGGSGLNKSQAEFRMTDASTAPVLIKTGVSFQFTGGGNPFDIRQPQIILIYCKKKNQ